MADKISQILETMDGDNATKTRIHSAFLNYTQLTEYVRVPTEDDLLRIDQSLQTFKTAEKGLRLLNTYNHIDDVVLGNLCARENTMMDLLYKIYSANGW